MEIGNGLQRTYITIYNRSSRTISGSIPLILRHREKSNVVTFAHDNDRNLWKGIDSQFLARRCKKEVTNLTTTFFKRKLYDEIHAHLRHGTSVSSTVLNWPSETPSR